MNEIDFKTFEQAVEKAAIAFRKLGDVIERAVKYVMEILEEVLIRKKKAEEPRKGWIHRTVLKLKEYLITRKPFIRARANL